jgi:hypothetical protein
MMPTPRLAFITVVASLAYLETLLISGSFDAVTALAGAEAARQA